jgi:deoxyribonuclease IV
MFKFGVAGYPLAFSESKYKKNRLKIFNWLRDLNLDAFEAQMTYGPKTSIENCQKIRELSHEFNIKVSIHAAYYIVLTSSDKEKIRRSIETLKKTFELADLMGADVIVLHPGPYYQRDPKMIFNILAENLLTFFKEIGNSEIGLFLETAGKKGQLGSVEEILALTKNINGCFPCFDFGHIHARTCGGLGTDKDIDELFLNLKSNGVFDSNSRVHFHYTPIHYGPQGEITHKAIGDTYPENLQQTLDLFKETKSDNFYHPRYNKIVEHLSFFKVPFTIISETHNSQEVGAMAMKAHYKKIKEL